MLRNHNYLYKTFVISDILRKDKICSDDFVFEYSSKNKIRIVKYTEEELKEAEALDSQDRNDALHALLAKKHGAKYLITKNIRHFKKFSHIIEPKFPKDI